VPDFALAQIARAPLCLVQASCGEGLDARAEFAGEVIPREARQIKTIATAIDGNGPSAMTLLEKHIAEYPRDEPVLGSGRRLAEGRRNIA
jgi:hypothetical protein